MDEWNRENPRLGLTATKRQGKLDGEVAEEAIEQSKDGDQILQQLSRYRGLLIPIKDWPLALRQFEAKWTRYKRDLRLLDFTDLIEQCLHDVPVAPTNPTVIFADEAQDLNRMQLTLVRKWGERANYFIVAGDDDQCIFSFTGASPDAILDPDIPDDHKIILKQSFRVPQCRASARGQTDPAAHSTPGENLPARGRNRALFTGSRLEPISRRNISSSGAPSST